MKFRLLLHTLYHLRMEQMVYQLLNRINRPQWKLFSISDEISEKVFPHVLAKPACLSEKGMNFLNICVPFCEWGYTDKGMLWAYNLNYMDWLGQKDMDYGTGALWIDNFIEHIGTNHVGLDPYPIALRTINWVKFICKYRQEIEPEKLKRWNDSLFSQYRLLAKKLEYHLLGNHLLEDAYALYIGAIYFADKKMLEKAAPLFKRELNEQILPDGAHYEQSPMYHCILLDRLLDCYNFSLHNQYPGKQASFVQFLQTKAELMLGHLEELVYADEAIPLLNDSAEDIAPTPTMLMNYAKRLGLRWKKIPMKECGYRKLQNEHFETIVDVGGIAASYQPGHTHADIFNYELRLHGKPFIVDTGISTYEKNSRRQYERSTAAHNTVTVNNKDNCEVWGGFRVGKRADVKIISETPCKIEARHNGTAKKLWHKRSFQLFPDAFTVVDQIEEENQGISFIHFSPDVRVRAVSPATFETETAVITINHADSVELRDEQAAKTYNSLQPIQVIAIHFHGNMDYTIRLKQK